MALVNSKNETVTEGKTKSDALVFIDIQAPDGTFHQIGLTGLKKSQSAYQRQIVEFLEKDGDPQVVINKLRIRVQLPKETVDLGLF